MAAPDPEAECVPSLDAGRIASNYLQLMTHKGLLLVTRVAMVVLTVVSLSAAEQAV
jgi:hypothetical protein